MLIHLFGILAIATGFALGLGNGVNVQPSYYNNGNVTFGWDLMSKYAQIKTVRIEIEPNYIYQAADWIKQARSHGYEVIATYHKWEALGSDDPNELLRAGDWWVQNYPALASAGSFTINLMNEWGSHYQTVDSYSNAYNQAIAKVRQVYAGSIVIDIPGWGQETRIATQAAPKIYDTNIRLSAHIYPSGWNGAANRYLVASDMDELASSGRPCILGEFGTGNGPVDVDSVINRAKQLGFPVEAWAWNGDGDQLNMVQPPWYQCPTCQTYHEGTYFNSVIKYL